MAALLAALAVAAVQSADGLAVPRAWAVSSTPPATQSFSPIRFTRPRLLGSSRLAIGVGDVGDADAGAGADAGHADAEVWRLEQEEADEVALRVADALAARGTDLARFADVATDCYRLFHGTTEGVAGLTIDRYGSQALVQTFREPLFSGDAGVDLALRIGGMINSALGQPMRLVLSHRGAGARGAGGDGGAGAVGNTGRWAGLYEEEQATIDTSRPIIFGVGEDGGEVEGEGLGDSMSFDLEDEEEDDGEEIDLLPPSSVGTESGMKVECALRPGKDPGIYLDFRAGREWIEVRSPTSPNYPCARSPCAMCDACTTRNARCTMLDARYSTPLPSLRRRCSRPTRRGNTC